MNKNLLKNNSNMLIALLPSEIKVIVIGGGRAAYIKSRTFALKGCRVYVLSPEFIQEFYHMKDNLNVDIIPGLYQKKYIEDKHIVVIATSDRELNEVIGRHCRELCKIYLDASEPENGSCIIPCQRNTENISLGINTMGVGVSPMTSRFIADEVVKYLKDYDDFVKFTSKVRNNMGNMEYREKVMRFVCTEDFYFFYRKGKSSMIMKMFFG
ncbi:NAD(P)-dependent oxidoreductase [Clostridium sp. WLY-B-L2]|uniref:precorrin-2 dehydrogenase n=1 Tax=Clostridium aromativorans TaxID=2836848 RepID=A0ABS8N8M2_9CLOT|nr:NAD(P)-dependent oxidoreductase [Clostridium aromativorans]MCC9295068.1 NAD(P)-dependent oxidoreductase [Clostridium aromativorans]